MDEFSDSTQEKRLACDEGCMHGIVHPTIYSKLLKV